MDDTIQKLVNDLIDNRAQLAFLLDFDGTMVDLVPHPDKVDVPPELSRAIRDLAASPDIAFAIVTGRSLAQIDKFLGGVFPAAMGNHGAECRSDHGAPIELLVSPMPEQARRAVADVGDRHACYFEDKIYTLSLHLPFTHAEDDLREELADALGDLKSSYDIRKTGRTHEILSAHVHKGSGIAHLMRQRRYAGRKPVYIGDDTFSDESLRVVTDLGGELIPAGYSQVPSAPQTGALLSPGEVRSFLLDLSLAADANGSTNCGTNGGTNGG